MKGIFALCVLASAGCATTALPDHAPYGQDSSATVPVDVLAIPRPPDSGVIRLLDSRMIQGLVRANRGKEALSLRAGAVCGIVIPSIFAAYVIAENYDDDEEESNCIFGPFFC